MFISMGHLELGTTPRPRDNAPANGKWQSARGHAQCDLFPQ
jgi:hypothetical protein